MGANFYKHKYHNSISSTHIITICMANETYSSNMIVKYFNVMTYRHMALKINFYLCYQFNYNVKKNYYLSSKSQFFTLSISKYLEMVFIRAIIMRLSCEWVCVCMFVILIMIDQQIYFYFIENWSNTMSVFRITLTLFNLMMCQSRIIFFPLLITERNKLHESKNKRNKSRRNSGKAWKAFFDFLSKAAEY